MGNLSNQESGSMQVLNPAMLKGGLWLRVQVSRILLFISLRPTHFKAPRWSSGGRGRRTTGRRLLSTNY